MTLGVPHLGHSIDTFVRSCEADIIRFLLERAGASTSLFSGQLTLSRHRAVSYDDNLHTLARNTLRSESDLFCLGLAGEGEEAAAMACLALLIHYEKAAHAEFTGRTGEQ